MGAPRHSLSLSLVAMAGAMPHQPALCHKIWPLSVKPEIATAGDSNIPTSNAMEIIINISIINFASNNVRTMFVELEFHALYDTSIQRCKLRDRGEERESAFEAVP